jgi:hypothetical protein
MNKIITAFNEVMSNKKAYKVQTATGHTGVIDMNNGDQDEYNEEFIFYKHPDFPEPVFLRETIHTDSYGDNESIVEVKFVEKKEKTIKIYEQI